MKLDSFPFQHSMYLLPLSHPSGSREKKKVGHIQADHQQVEVSIASILEGVIKKGIWDIEEQRQGSIDSGNITS